MLKLVCHSNMLSLLFTPEHNGRSHSAEVLCALSLLAAARVISNASVGNRWGNVNAGRRTSALRLSK